jgi:hypothetical protein
VVDDSSSNQLNRYEAVTAADIVSQASNEWNSTADFTKHSIYNLAYLLLRTGTKAGNYLLLYQKQLINLGYIRQDHQGPEKCFATMDQKLRE